MMPCKAAFIPLCTQQRFPCTGLQLQEGSSKVIPFKSQSHEWFSLLSFFMHACFTVSTIVLLYHSGESQDWCILSVPQVGANIAINTNSHRTDYLQFAMNEFCNWNHMRLWGLQHTCCSLNVLTEVSYIAAAAAAHVCMYIHSTHYTWQLTRQACNNWTLITH